MDLQIEKVDYYLDGGGTISYTYHPGSSVFNLIDDIVRQYTFQYPYRGPSEILIRQSLMLSLKKELVAIRGIVSGSPMSRFTNELRVFGLKIISVTDLPWPVFYGDYDEYINNDFNSLLEEHIA